jgi:hypothetical protein
MEAFHSAWQRLNTCAAEQGVNLNSPGNATAVAATSNKSDMTVPSPANPPDTLQLLYSSGLEKQAGITQKNLREDSDALDSTMQYVFDIERTTAPLCSQMNTTDQALLMLAQHESEGSK